MRAPEAVAWGVLGRSWVTIRVGPPRWPAAVSPTCADRRHELLRLGTADFLVPQVPGQYANRIYLEWGSVDVYNTLQFIGTDGNPIRFWQRFGGHVNRGLRA